MLQASKLPCAQIDNEGQTIDGETSGLLRRDLFKILFGTLGFHTLARGGDARFGTVDRQRLRKELETTIDDSIRLMAYHRHGGLLLDQGPDRDHLVSNIAAEGFGCCALVLGVERGILSYDSGAEIFDGLLTAIEQSPAICHKGWLSHLIDLSDPQNLQPYCMIQGERRAISEFSSIDTTLFLTGALIAATYFGNSFNISTRVNRLLESLDFSALLPEQRFSSRGAVLSHGFNFDADQIPHFWDTCSEGVIVSLLSQAQKNPSVSSDVWYQWDRRLSRLPLFTTYYPLTFLDLRDCTDASGLDLWERAEIRMLEHFQECSPYLPGGLYGVTACHTLEPVVCSLPKREYRVLDRIDASTEPIIAPHAVLASLPFIPDQAQGAIRTLRNLGILNDGYGPLNSANLSSGLIDRGVTTIDVGSALLMMDAFLDGTIHRLSNRTEAIKIARERCRILPRTARPLVAGEERPVASVDTQ